jgi:hypothetical protein
VTAERQASLADVSSIVQESLSVSGILLGKTMGRSGDLALRFENESQRLAGLEVRSRMTGRWMMAAIQTTFAVMPALVYLFAGWTIERGATAITIGTLVAFTTLQTRLFFPVGSLLGVSLDVQTSLALFDRIFDYLDQTVDIEERDDPVELLDAGDVVFDGVSFRYGEERWTLHDVTFRVPAGSKTALVGETGSGKTTLGYLAARLYDVGRGRIAIGGAKFVQSFIQQRRKLLPVGIDVCIVILWRHLGGPLLVEISVIARPPGVGGAVAGNVVEPPREIAIARQLPRLLRQQQKDRLRDVLRLVARQPPGRRVHHPAMPADDFREGLAVAIRRVVFE